MPRVSTYTVVPVARARCRPPTGADGASGSGADPSLSNEFFRWIIETCMQSSAIQSGAPSCQRICQLAQEVVHNSIDPNLSFEELLGLVREEAVRVCAVVFANLFPPHIRQVLLMSLVARVEPAAMTMTVEELARTLEEMVRIAETMLMMLQRVGPTVAQWTMFVCLPMVMMMLTGAYS